jgi:hypothetical protein
MLVLTNMTHGGPTTNLTVAMLLVVLAGQLMPMSLGGNTLQRLPPVAMMMTVPGLVTLLVQPPLLASTWLVLVPLVVAMMVLPGGPMPKQELAPTCLEIVVPLLVPRLLAMMVLAGGQMPLQQVSPTWLEIVVPLLLALGQHWVQCLVALLLVLAGGLLPLQELAQWLLRLVMPPLLRLAMPPLLRLGMPPLLAMLPSLKLLQVSVVCAFLVQSCWST